MGTHTGDPVGAEYFAAHAGIALQDCGSEAREYDAAMLTALHWEATEFRNRLDHIITTGREPVTIHGADVETDDAPTTGKRRA